jgi:hypothetical protein
VDFTIEVFYAGARWRDRRVLRCGRCAAPV